MKKIFVVLMLALVGLAFMGCADDAYVASQNLSQLADNFGVYRRAVFYNGITNEYILISIIINITYYSRPCTISFIRYYYLIEVHVTSIFMKDYFASLTRCRYKIHITI